MAATTIHRLRRAWLWAAAACTLAPPVQAQRVREVQIAPPFLRMRLDAETRVIATAYDFDGSPVDARFRWSSSNINVVTVTPDGLIRAVTPGTAIVTASVDSGPRRRSGRLTVFVSSGVPPGVVVRPHPPTPPMPPAAVESLVRASVDCTEPMTNTINPVRACYDRRPMARGRVSIPVPTACDKPPREVTALAHVNEDGAVREVRLFLPSFCSAFNDSAAALVQRLTFEPALKDGRPIRAWARVTVAGQLP